MANPAVTYSFTNGTTIDAGEVNTNFTDLINSLTDGTKSLSIDALTVAGAGTFNGNNTLGNSSSDDITFTGSLASTIPIKTTATYNIGSSTLGLAGIYFGGNSQTTRIISSGSASATYTITLPVSAGTKGHALQNSDGAGVLAWAPLQTASSSVSSADYTVLDTDGFKTLHVTTGSTDRRMTLPTAADNAGRTIIVVKIDSGTGFVIVDGENTETINGQLTYNLYAQYDMVEVLCDGTGWYVTNSRHHWVAFTPTWTNSPTWSSNLGWFRRDVDSILIKTYGIVSAGGAGSPLQLAMPASLTISTTKTPNVDNPGFILSAGRVWDNSAGTVFAVFPAYDSTATKLDIHFASGSQLNGSSIDPSDRLSLDASIPITEFA